MQHSVESLAIQPGPNKRFLVRAADPSKPVMWKADTAWELFARLTREEAIIYLDNRKARGFNVIMAVALTELDNVTPRGDPNEVTGPGGEVLGSEVPKTTEFSFLPNRQGDLPLHDNDPSKPNEAYFTHIDWVVKSAAERGLLVVLVPTWARWINMGWTSGPVLLDEHSAESFGRFIGQRYPFLPKILGGDTNPFWTGGGELFKRYAAGGRAPYDEPLPTYEDLPVHDSRPLFRAMARGIVEAEQPFWTQRFAGQTPFLTYHPTALWLPKYPEARASAYWNDEDWLTMDAVQSGHADFPNLPFSPPLAYWNSRSPHVAISHMWNNTPVRPCIDLEGHYEALHNALNSKNEWMWGEHDIRTGAWQSVLSGAVGYVYGANSVWQMYEKDPSRPAVEAVCGLDPSRSWRSDINLPGPSCLPHLWSLLESLSSEVFHARSPAQDILVASSAPDDLDSRVTVMRDVYVGKEGESTILIAHSGHGEKFELDVKKVFGTKKVEAWWLDPRTGKECSVEGDVSSGIFTPPSRGGLEHDWVLVLRA